MWGGGAKEGGRGGPCGEVKEGEEACEEVKEGGGYVSPSCVPSAPASRCLPACTQPGQRWSAPQHALCTRLTVFHCHVNAQGEDVGPPLRRLALATPTVQVHPPWASVDGRGVGLCKVGVGDASALWEVLKGQVSRAPAAAALTLQGKEPA